MNLSRSYAALVKLYPEKFRVKNEILINDAYSEGLAESSSQTLYNIHTFVELPFSILEENIRSLLQPHSLHERWWQFFNLIALSFLIFATWASTKEYFLAQNYIGVTLLILAPLFGITIFKLTRNGVLAITMSIVAVFGFYLETSFGAYQNILNFPGGNFLHNLIFILGWAYAVYFYCLQLAIGYSTTKPGVWLSSYQSSTTRPSWKNFLLRYAGLFVIGMLLLELTMIPIYTSSEFSSLFNISDMVGRFITTTLLPALLILFVYRRVGVRSTGILLLILYIGLNLYLYNLFFGNLQFFSWSFGPDPLIGKLIDIFAKHFLQGYDQGKYSFDLMYSLSILLNVIGYAVRPLIQLFLGWVAIYFPGFVLHIPHIKKQKALVRK